MYCMHNFLRELKGQVSCTNYLLFLLILMDSFIWDFSVMGVLILQKEEFKF